MRNLQAVIWRTKSLSQNGRHSLGHCSSDKIIISSKVYRVDRPLRQCTAGVNSLVISLN